MEEPEDPLLETPLLGNSLLTRQNDLKVEVGHGLRKTWISSPRSISPREGRGSSSSYGAIEGERERELPLHLSVSPPGPRVLEHLFRSRRSRSISPRHRQLSHRSKTEASLFSENILRRHSWVYTMMNARSRQPQAQAYKFVVTCAILFSTFSFILSTLPILNHYERYFDFVEAVTSYLFLLEFVIRVIVITESKKYFDPCKGRLKFICTVSSLLDIVSFTPYFMEQLAPKVDLPNLQGIRVLRIFRILKTSKFSKPFMAAYRVLWFNSEILWVAFTICLLLMLLTSSTMYYLAPEASEDDFSSIPATMYLSIMMLTGQGQPSGHLPWYTKLVVMTTSVFAVGMFAIPASMLTWGFEAEAARLVKVRKRKAEKRRRQIADLRELQAMGQTAIGPAALVSLVQSDSSVTSSSLESQFSYSQSSAWEEYERVLLGVSDDEVSANSGQEGHSDCKKLAPSYLPPVTRLNSTSDPSAQLGTKSQPELSGQTEKIEKKDSSEPLGESLNSNVGPDWREILQALKRLELQQQVLASKLDALQRQQQEWLRTQQTSTS
eukprot:g74996.t1